MNMVVEGLSLASRSLQKVQKARLIEDLLQDAEFREAIAEQLVDRLVGPPEMQEADDIPPAGPEPTPGHDQNGTLQVTPRQFGRQSRERYLRTLQVKGIKIEQLGGIWARTPEDLWVAIPFATEVNQNRWFLGFQGDQATQRSQNDRLVVILLCQPKTGPILDFVVPADSFKHLDKCRNEKGNLKINVTKVGDRYKLGIPGANPLDITGWQGRLSVLGS